MDNDTETKRHIAELKAEMEKRFALLERRLEALEIQGEMQRAELRYLEAKVSISTTAYQQRMELVDRRWTYLEKRYFNYQPPPENPSS